MGHLKQKLPLSLNHSTPFSPSWSLFVIIHLDTVSFIEGWLHVIFSIPYFAIILGDVSTHMNDPQRLLCTISTHAFPEVFSSRPLCTQSLSEISLAYILIHMSAVHVLS
jgi:hypothetical protein